VAAFVRTVTDHQVCKKGGAFIDQLSDYQHLKDNSAPWSYGGTKIKYISLLRCRLRTTVHRNPSSSSGHEI